MTPSDSRLQEPAGNPAGLADPLGQANEFRAQAQARYDEASTLNTEADALMARSEIVIGLSFAQGRLAESLADLERARAGLVAAQARYEPMAAKLDAARAELAALPPDLPDDDTSDDAYLEALSVDDVVVNRARRDVLGRVASRLASAVERRRSDVVQAEQVIHSIEHDELPEFRRNLAGAQAAMAHPPLHSMIELAKVAPDTVKFRAGRIGPALLMAHGGAQATTAEVSYIMAGLKPTLIISGLWQAIRTTMLNEVLSVVDNQTSNAIAIRLGLVKDPNVAGTDPAEQWARGREAAGAIAGRKTRLLTDAPAGDGFPAQRAGDLVTPGVQNPDPVQVHVDQVASREQRLLNQGVSPIITQAGQTVSSVQHMYRGPGFDRDE